MTDPLERLTNLLALLLETRVPLTLHDISQELRGQYPGTDTGRRAAFEREKAQMRSVGIPISTTVMSGDRAGQTGYWIERSEFELGDLGLTDDEREALQLAVAAVHLGGGWADDALIKLGGSVADNVGPLSAMLPTSANLPPLFDAVSKRCPVEFRYHEKGRHFEPWGLLARGGFWYVIGYDRDAGEQRTYRVDRMEGDVRVGADHAFQRPDDFDPRVAFPADAKLMGDAGGATEAIVLVDADRARAVVLELGVASVVERRTDGSVVVRVPCVNHLVFRSWVLGFVEHAEVLGPPEVREEIMEWLVGVVGRG